MLSKALTQTPTISVVIPAYNARAFILDALESVRRQTRRPDAIIVVDDGSTDGTSDVVRHWSLRTGTFVDLLRQPNGGAAAARNAGIRRTLTTYMALLDADDLFEPNHLAVLEAALHAHPEAVLAFGRSRLVAIDGRNIGWFPGTRIDRVPVLAEHEGVRLLGPQFATLAAGSYIAVSATLLKRAAAHAIGLMDEDLSPNEDLDFLLRLSRIGSFAYAPQLVASTRRHAANTTHPRNAFQTNLAKFKTLSKAKRHAARLRLTADERQATEEATKELVPYLLYGSSRRGLRTYLRMWVQLVRAGFIVPCMNPRHGARAMIYSVMPSGVPGLSSQSESNAQQVPTPPSPSPMADIYHPKS